MRILALEEHFLPAGLAREIIGGRGQAEAVADRLAEYGDGRIAVLDRAGIDVQVLSVVAPGPQEGDVERGVALARQLNDAGAAAVAAHPDRFRAFASLPMQDPDAAAGEARRAVEELGFVGVIVNGHTAGHFLDEPRFEPVLAAIEALGVPIYLHPTYPPDAVMRAYFSELPSADVAARLSTAAWGWHAETGLHVLRMVVGGAFERHPGLQVVVGHMGENLPFSLMRADSVLSGLAGVPPVAETVLGQVHVTICGYATVSPLRCALEVFGADRVLFSTDYPFGDPEQHTAFLAAAPLAPADREKIAHGNAENLLAL